MGWDVTHYVDKLPKKSLPQGSDLAKAKEASMKKQFILLDGFTASTPCIIIDLQGIIMAWYLPNILSSARQVGLLSSNCIKRPNTPQSAMLVARQKLCSLLDSSIHSRCWCDDLEYFHLGEESLQGSVKFSPAWFQQGHDVSAPIHRV